MAEIVLGIVGPAIELGKCIAAPIKRQFNYLCCFNSNVQSLEEEAKKLGRERAGLEMEVATAKNDLRQIDPKVVAWLEEEKEIQREASELGMKTTNIRGGGCLFMKSHYSLSKRAYKIAEAMKQKEIDCRNISIISHPRLPPATRVPSMRPTRKFQSRKGIEEQVMASLRDEKVKITGICGMGGVGKTHLTNKVRKMVMDEKLFEESLISVVSQEVNMDKLQCEIAGNLGLTLVGKDLRSKAQELRTRLKNGKRILIVLDDVWKNLKLEDLGIPCESGRCSIILTSRDKGVLEEMDAKPIHVMETLGEEEAFSFFKENLGFCVDDENQLFGLAKEISKKCKGLPLALINVAGVLKCQKSIHRWKNALRELRSANRKDLPKVLEGVYPPLRLSYNFLDEQNARSVFLLCCLFPEDYNIPIEDLVVYAMGLRMFEGIQELELVRDTTYSMVEVLKSRFLLLEGMDVRNVMMHDVVRDVAIYIASEEKYIKYGDKTAWISPHLGERIEVSGLTSSKLCFLMIDVSVNKELRFKDIPFEGMKKLNVLSIRNGFSFRSLHFPKSVRTLILVDCKFSMRLVGELVNLEVLICRNCSDIGKLPHEIKCLRLLEISRCKDVKIRAGVISNLNKLEELKIVNSFDRWEAGDEEKEHANVGLYELKYLSNLTRLEIQVKDYNLAAEHTCLPPMIKEYHISVGEISPSNNAIMGCDFQPHPWQFGKIMRLCLPGKITLGKWIQKCVENAEYLYLEGEGSSCVDMGADQINIRWLTLRNCTTASLLFRRCGATIGFPLLETLVLSDLDKLKEISESNDSFNNLKEFSLDNLPALKHLWKKISNVVSLCTNLSRIYIRKCHSLVNLFPLSIGNGCFPQLQFLIIEDCNMMEQVFSWNEEEGNEKNVGHDSRHITATFPKLERLQLSYLPNLRVFYLGIERIEFPLLTRIQVKMCPQLSGLVSNFDGIRTGDHCKEKVSFEIVNTFSPQILIASFTQLETLQIKELGNMKSLFSFSTAQNLVNLKSLTIDSCLEMVKVIEEDGKECSHGMTLLFPHLQKLTLCYLPKLKTFCICRRGLVMPELEDVIIEYCWEMEQVFLWNEEEYGKEIIEQSNRGQHNTTFPKLNVGKLNDLPRLSNFFQGIGSVELPLLARMMLLRCPNLEVLISTTTSSSTGGINSKVMGKLNEQALCCYSLSIWHQFPLDNFTGLEILSVNNFDKINFLFSTSIADSLVNLQELSIQKCKNLVKVVEEEVDESHETILIFPHLEELRLVHLPKLNTFCASRRALNFPWLKTVCIDNCPKLERSSFDIIKDEITLNEVVEIHKEKDEREEKEEEATLSEGYQDRNEIYEIEENVGKLEEQALYWMLSIGDKIPIDNFTRVELLCIGGFDKICCLFSNSISNNLINLKELTIRNCKNLVKLIEEEVDESHETSLLFSHLKKLFLEELPKLKIFCEWRCAIMLPLLEEISVCNCPEMERFSLGSLTTPKLYFIYIEHNNIFDTGDLNNVLQQRFSRVKETSSLSKSEEDQEENDEEISTLSEIEEDQEENDEIPEKEQSTLSEGEEDQVENVKIQGETSLSEREEDKEENEEEISTLSGSEEDQEENKEIPEEEQSNLSGGEEDQEENDKIQGETSSLSESEED